MWKSVNIWIKYNRSSESEMISTQLIKAALLKKSLSQRNNYKRCQCNAKICIFSHISINHSKQCADQSADPEFSWWHPEMSPALVLPLLLPPFCTRGIVSWLGWRELITLTLYREDRNDSITHLCMNSMILSLLRSCGSVYFSSPFSKYLRVGKPEILKRSPAALCTVASTAANTPGLCKEISTPDLKSQQPH